jgi:multidrug transporter EmrE-like cation transporter
MGSRRRASSARLRLVNGRTILKFQLSLLAALLLNACANLFMKVGMKGLHASGGVLRDGVWFGLFKVLSTPVLVIGLFCFAANAACYMYALQSPALKISLAYPIMVGGGFAVIALVARFHPLLAERLDWSQWMGVGFVLFGIILIASRSQNVP